MSKRQTGRKSVSQRTSVGHDMFQNLLNNPISSASSSSAGQSSNAAPNNTSPLGFASYAPPIASPFTLAPDDPRNAYQHNAWYQQSQQNINFYPPPPPTNASQHFQQPPPHYYQQQPNFYQPSPHNTQYSPNIPSQSTQPSPSSPPPEEIDEIVPQKRKQSKWTNDDARILAERWVHVSQNSIRGNKQPIANFWGTLQADFNKLASEVRNVNQLTGKWNKISHDVKIFNPIFRYLHSHRPSGARDEDVLTAAREQFQQQTGRRFIYEQCWEALKVYPKFYTDDGAPVRKRTTVNLDDDEVIPSTFPTQDPTLNRNMEMLFRDDPIRRPIGRDTSKKSARHSISSDAATSSRSSRDETMESVREAAEAQKKTLAKLEELAEKKMIYKAWNFLQKKIPKGLSKKRREMMKQAQKATEAKFDSDFKMMFGWSGDGSSSQQNNDDKDDDDDDHYEDDDEGQDNDDDSD